MLIVVLSMPRIPCANDYVEAGRFWLLLLSAWSLLYLAVVAGCAAFVCSAVSMLPGVLDLTGPLLACGLILLCGGWLMARRLASVYPGKEAVWLATWVGLPGWMCFPWTAAYSRGLAQQAAAEGNASLLQMSWWKRFRAAEQRRTQLREPRLMQGGAARDALEDRDVELAFREP